MSTVCSLKPTDEDRLLERMERERGNLLCVALQFIRDGRTGSQEERIRKASKASGIPERVLHSEHFSRLPKSVFQVRNEHFVSKAPATHNVQLGQKAKEVPGQESLIASNPKDFIG